ncbi:MAG: T9SS type A sorting domain-containing protein, partial [Ignavibacterium sp.]|nr:T9SS type A sorting domain-containing protein [Ignavibacterium sp.]
MDEYKEAGKYEIEFNATGLSSGVYFYKLVIGNFTATRKLILMR